MKRRLASLTVFLSAGAACAIFAVSSIQPARLPVQELQAPITAFQLFQGPELAEVATDNLMSLGRGQLGAGDRAEVRAHVVAGFGNVSKMMAQRFPDVLVELSSLRLTPRQKSAVLAAMRGLGDSRVQGLGREVALQAHGALRISKEKGGEELERRLMAYLTPRLPAIRRLRDEIVPEVLRPGGDGEGGELRLERLRVARRFHKWRLEVDVSGVEAPLPARRLGMATALMVGVSMLEHAEEFFKHVQAVASKMVGDRLPQLIDAVKQLDVGDLMNCAMSTVVSAGLVDTIKCGVRFATAGMDVLRSVMSGSPGRPSVPGSAGRPSVPGSAGRPSVLGDPWRLSALGDDPWQPSVQ